MKPPFEFFRQRAWVLGIGACAAFVAGVSVPTPPPRTVEGLAALLGQAAGAVVAPGDVAWESSPGFLAETFVGRRVLFLGAPTAGAPRDLYRAWVRVTLDGQPIGVRRVRNLTETPLGDDMALDVRGGRAVFATVAFGHIQGISVLELDGIRAEDRPESAFARVLLMITSWQRAGSPAGVGRTDVMLDVPARAAELRLDQQALKMSFDGGGREAQFDLAERTLHGRDGEPAYAARAVPQHHQAKPFVHWAVDTLRAEVGPEPIAWLEDKVFGAEDVLKRTTYTMFASQSERALKDGGEAQTARVLDASKLGEAESSWPPPPVPSIWQETKPGEGEWQPVSLPWLEPLPGSSGAGARPPPYFYTTVNRPDPKRPYSELLLIAMDMRQLELGMEAGFEDPEPVAGPPGAGRLPREKEITDRIVATFNGAFKTTHGKYGMMVNRRVLIPPVKGAATVMVTEDRQAGLGSWPQSEEIPPEITSYRQNLDPLVEDGVANPTGRYIWGWQLSGQSVLTERTALCVTSAGHLYYAWGKELDGPILGKALRQAGCSYAVHLDMNPGHCGFVFTDVVDLKNKEFHLKKAHQDMRLAPDRFVRWSAKDFFYVMLRDPTPTDASRVRWVPDGATQPPPAWLPGVFRGSARLGSLEVRLESFERARVEWRVRAGTREPSVLGAPPKKLELGGDDEHRVVAAIGLGHTTEATRYGLAFEGKGALPLRRAYATVIASPGGALRIAPAGEIPILAPEDEAVQLPVLAEDGAPVAIAAETGAMRERGALCVTPGDRVVVATVRHDSNDPLVAALLRLGCKRIVELDRGSRHPAFVHRSGSATPPLVSYETSVLYALGRPMIPFAFRWKPAGAVPSKTPTGYDFSPKKR